MVMYTMVLSPVAWITLETVAPLPSPVFKGKEFGKVVCLECQAFGAILAVGTERTHSLPQCLQIVL
jgi:hypothetical protein